MSKKLIVTKGSVPCELILRNCFRSKRRFLAPTAGNAPKIFSGFKAANNAIARTIALTALLKGSMVDEQKDCKRILVPGEFKVEAAAKK